MTYVSSVVLCLSLCLSTVPPEGESYTAGGTSGVSGVVVDPSGRPVPRAIVQILAADGSTATSVLTEADGTFRAANAPDRCRVVASLAGFQQATAECAAGPLRLALGVAPVAENIVVSATRTEAPAGQVASSVTVFDTAEMERRQQPLLAELLRTAPGTMVVRTGGLGTVTSLFVRAGESNYTKVLLDGVPLNEPGGTFNLSNVTTENLERVEFVRGANSALYGSDAMTGVVQLFTRRGVSTQPDVRAQFEVGTFSTMRASSSAAGRTGRFDYSADASGFRTDNESPNNEFDNVTLSGSAGVRMPRGALLRTIARMERGTVGTPGQTAFGRPDMDASFKRRDGVWGVSFDQTAGAVRHAASYGLATSRQESSNTEIDPDYVPSFEGRTAPFAFSDFPFKSRNELRRHHARYQIDGTIATRRAGTHIETALVDWNGERATLTDVLAGTTVPASRDNAGVTLQHQALWPRVFLTAGVRFEHNASFGHATVPRFSAAWYLREGNGDLGTTRLHATGGLGIKEPTILQSFSPNPFFLGNPDLEPERARGFDVGLEQRFARDRARVDFTWFDNRYRNIITTQTISFSPFRSQYLNVALTEARGAELTGDVALVSGFRAKVGYTFTDSEILDSDVPNTSTSPVFKVGNWAFRRPRHSGFAGVSWTGGRAALDLSGSIVGRRVDSDFSSLSPAMMENEGYTLWNVRGSVQVMRALAITGAIDNLTGSDHMDPLGYPALGRAARIGIRTKW